MSCAFRFMLPLRRMPLVRCMLFWCVFLCATPLAPAQTIRLEGRLIHAEGLETGQVGLSFGPFGTTVTRSDGFFTHAFPAETEEATLEIADEAWTVLYPRGGRIPIPRGEHVIVEVVAGDPIERVITRMLAEKHQRLLSELTTIGTEQDEIRDILASFLEQVRRSVELDEAEFERAIDEAAERNEHYPEISSALNEYLLRAKNLSDAFRLLAELAVSNPGVVETLDSTLLAYNDAFETLNSRRHDFQQAVATYWQNERLAAEFQSLMDFALGDVHRSSMLRLNESIVGLHELQAMRGSARREHAREIAAEIRRTVSDLEPRIAELERRTERMLEALFTL